MRRSTDSVSTDVRALKIGNKVRELRQKHQYTLQDVAAKTGLSKPFLSQIENRPRSPSRCHLAQAGQGIQRGAGSLLPGEVDTEKKDLVTRRTELVRMERRPHHARER